MHLWYGLGSLSNGRTINFCYDMIWYDMIWISILCMQMRQSTMLSRRRWRHYLYRHFLRLTQVGPDAWRFLYSSSVFCFRLNVTRTILGFFPFDPDRGGSIVVSVSVCLFVRCVCVLRKLVLKRDQCLQEHSVDFWAFRCKNVLTEVSRLLTIRQRLTRVKL